MYIAQTAEREVLEETGIVSGIMWDCVRVCLHCFVRRVANYGACIVRVQLTVFITYL